VNGLNNRAVAINCNALLQLAPSKRGLPVAFIVRSVLEKGSFEEALCFVKAIDHASGQNYLLAGRRG